MKNNLDEIDEDFITDLIKIQLEKRKVGKIKKDLGLYKGNKFKKLWIEKYNEDIPILHTQIDLILKMNNNDLNAIEIKYFKTGKRHPFNYSYYKGIEQAIAYLRYGFDHVALWQVFDNIQFSYFKHYGKRTWEFLRELELPIDFSFFIFDSTDNSLRAVGKKLPNDYKKLKKLEDYPDKMGWRYPNPYRNSSEGKKFREIIDEILNEYFNEY